LEEIDSTGFVHAQTLVSIRLGHQISLTYKFHLTCFSSIYLSFVKLWCENTKKITGTENSILHTSSVSSSKRYIKMQSACRPKGHLLASFPPVGHLLKIVKGHLLASFPPEGHLLTNHLTPHTLYKPQHTPVVQWYQYYCARILAQLFLPVTAIWRLPFALLFLTSFLLGFLGPRLITSALGLIYLTLPMM
jgi:hypothetical protein